MYLPHAFSQSTGWEWGTPSSGSVLAQDSSSSQTSAKTSGHVILNEIYLNQKGFVEIKNKDTEPVDISGWYVSTQTGSTLTPTNLAPVPNGAVLLPDQLYLMSTIDLSLNPTYTITLHNKKKETSDTAQVTRDAAAERSLVRVFDGSQFTFTTQDYIKNDSLQFAANTPWVSSDLRTPGANNMLMQIQRLADDTDRDFLHNVKEDSVYKTKKDLFDTDGDLLPDMYELQNGLSPTIPETKEMLELHLPRYKEILMRSVMMNIDIVNQAPLLSGKMMPKSKLHIEIPSKGIKTMLTADADGVIAKKLPGIYLKGNLDINIAVEDQSGVITYSQKPISLIVPETVDGGAITSADQTSSGSSLAAKSLVINEIYPSPNTQNDEEWIELKNTTQKSIDISRFKLTDNSGKEFTITENTFIRAKEFLVLSKNTTKLDFNNAGDTISLVTPFATLYQSVTYPTIKTAESYAKKSDFSYGTTAEPTKGKDNVFPQPKPVVITPPVTPKPVVIPPKTTTPTRQIIPSRISQIIPPSLTPNLNTNASSLRANINSAIPTKNPQVLFPRDFSNQNTNSATSGTSSALSSTSSTLDWLNSNQNSLNNNDNQNSVSITLSEEKTSFNLFPLFVIGFFLFIGVLIAVIFAKIE